MTYGEFLSTKHLAAEASGIDPVFYQPKMFDFQRDIVRWALRRGRAAIFADCGLGKTLMGLQWAHSIAAHGNGGRVLIATPLAVAPQFVREGEKFNLPCVYRREDKDDLVTVTNYEMLDHFDPANFIGIVLDESSILKSFTGKFRNKLITEWGRVRYRLAATATPAPNDFMELGNHAEFLGAMSRTEMLSRFFVHDGGETQKWRLKGHAHEPFWTWVCSWAVLIRKPSDLGYDDGGFVLPGCKVDQVRVETDLPKAGMLFALEANTLQERQQARRVSVEERVDACRQLVESHPDEPWLIWCNLNVEGDALTKAIPGAVQVKGADSREVKEERLFGFIDGKYRVLVTKPLIAGFGLNLQHCAKMAFVGLSDSWEQYYQAVRRCHRFGQEREVNVYIITADQEGAVVRNIERKQAQADAMVDMMISNMRDISKAEIQSTKRLKTTYEPKAKMAIPAFL